MPYVQRLIVEVTLSSRIPAEHQNDIATAIAVMLQEVIPPMQKVDFFPDLVQLTREQVGVIVTVPLLMLGLPDIWVTIPYHAGSGVHTTHLMPDARMVNAIADKLAIIATSYGLTFGIRENGYYDLRERQFPAPAQV